ncbi:FHA domain-containing protein [Chloroflexota bacterium]
METEAILVVQKGDPYEEGKVLVLRPEKTLLGRSWGDSSPEVPFDDPRVSRSHAEISFDNGQFSICDLPASKHGVEVNGAPLTKGTPRVLNHNDEISLAKGTVVMRFCYQSEEGMTLEFDGFSPDESVSVQERIIVDEDRREVLVRGEELRPRVTGNEFELILLLYQNQGKAVSHEDIIDWVWRDVPLRDTITRQDVNTLAHRLRKSLGDDGACIENIPSYGYRIDQSGGA